MDTWEKLDLGLVMTVLSIGIVFLVLIFLTQLIGLFERFFGARKGPAAEENKASPQDTTRERGAPTPRPSPPAPAAAAPAAPQKAPPVSQPAAAAAPAVRPTVVAAVMAAVSAYLQSEALALAPPVRRLPDDLSFWGRSARLEQMMSRRL